MAEKTNVQKERDALADQDRDTIKQAQREYAEKTYGAPAQEAGDNVVSQLTLDSVDDLPSAPKAAATKKAVKAETSEGDKD